MKLLSRSVQAGLLGSKREPRRRSPVFAAAVWLTGLLSLFALLTLGMPVSSQAETIQLSERDIALYRRAFAALEERRWADAKALAGHSESPLLGAVLTWLTLLRRPGEDVSFADVTDFIESHPDWPGMGTLRRRAEDTVPVDLTPAKVVDWFEKHPPQTANGVFEYAKALRSLGQGDRLRTVLKDHWHEASLTEAQESRLLSRFADILTVADHRERLDEMIWDYRFSAAERLYPLVGQDYEQLARARIRLARRLPGVDGAVDRVPDYLQDHPGLVYERARWRRRADLNDGTEALLLRAPNELGRPWRWWLERHILARRFLDAGEYRRAYRLVTDHRQVEGLGLAQAEFLAGWLALRFLDRPGDASQHFKRLYDNVTTPISRARGAYWAGRAAKAQSHETEARRWFGVAAVFPTTFYGQLAADELGIPLYRLIPGNPPIRKADAIAFERRTLVRIVRQLAILDMKELDGVIEPFLWRLSFDAETIADHVLVARLADHLGFYQIAVSTARSAAADDIILTRDGYPLMPIAGVTELEPAFVHGLIRQESGFDIGAISRSGARGLMQLMPATARQVARELDVDDHSTGRLTLEPVYNVQLGSTYLEAMLSRFDGSYFIAAAAYNGGPNRLSRWLSERGDPRPRGLYDVIDWIEAIPIYETRNYVQRVLEGTQIYRVRLREAGTTRTLTEDLTR